MFLLLQVFDLQIPKGAHDVFTLVVNLLGEYLMPKKIITNLFEAFKTSRKSLARSLQNLLNQLAWAKRFLLMSKMKVQVYIP